MEGEWEDEDGEREEEEEDLELRQAADETQALFENIYLHPEATPPGYPGVTGADAWDPAPPSSKLLEPGSDAVATPMDDDYDFDAMMDEWERLIVLGRHGEALSHVENSLAGVPSLPPLYDLQRMQSERERRKQSSRERQAALAAEYKARRIQRINEHGYSHGVGKRKTSSAQVWLKLGTGKIRINRKPLDVAMPSFNRRADVLAPFAVTGTLARFDMVASVRGGGEMGKAQAIRHALARALENFYPPLRPPLKRAGYFTRDPRMVERKKPGRKKARKAFQWVKR
ncbi:hypothetical protein WJX81_003359 [Elliptochloris bilobata]|uniref:Small ribosomal subunit protein uS9c n=1 Tax=Elliptochloris bilobata TaxID=381761 RepID=A0AAW1SD50_9CHLO